MQKHYLIIGGSKGIGKAFIQECLLEDIKVSLISRNSIDIKHSNLYNFNHDLENISELNSTLQSIIDKNGSIDTITFFQKFRPQHETINILESECKVSLESTQVIIEFMKNFFKKDGLNSIVLIGSIANSYIAQEQPASYHIAKSGLLGLMKYYAVTLGELNIRVNSISPSTVIKNENKEFYRQNKDLYDLYSSLSPLNRVAQAEDIVHMVNFLISNKASFITGQDIIIDGGISLQWQESLARKLSSFENLQVTQDIKIKK